LKDNYDSLQIKLNATLQKLGEKENQVESLLTDSGELKKTLVQKTQRYDETVTELRSEVQNLGQENQDIAKRLFEKQQESVLLTNQITESKQEFTVALEEWNKLTKSQEKQISMKDLTISQLAANVQQLELSICAANADLTQKLAILNQLQISSQEEVAELEASRQQVLELQTQAQHKAATIGSLKERVVMLETKSKSDVVEMEKLNSHQLQYQTQLTQANARISDLVSQVNVLSLNSGTLQGKLDDTAKEYQAAQGLLAEKVALVARLQIALDTAQQRALTAESSLKEKDDVITALKSMFDGRDVMMKPHEPKGSHPRSGMMNLRGCAWYWWTTLPSALIPLVTELSI
jgi:chromosome segregation ATPase